MIPIKISEQDKKIIDRAIDKLAILVSGIKFKLGSWECWHKEYIPICTHLYTNKSNQSDVDTNIAIIVNELRSSLRHNFYERFAFRAMERIDTVDNDNYNLAVTVIRIFDALPFIIALSKKWLDKPYISIISESDARSELKSRGLI